MSMNMNAVAFTLAGKQYTFGQVANEFSQLQDTFDLYKDEREGLGVHFLLMVEGKDLSGFLTICTGIEANKGWKSKQNPGGTEKAPQAWKQYKSNAKAFLELGGTLEEVSTVSELNKALQALRKESASGQTNDEATETVTQSIGVAAQANQSFANTLAKLASIYGSLTPDVQEELEQILVDVVNTYKKEVDDAGKISELVDTAIKQGQAA